MFLLKKIHNMENFLAVRLEKSINKYPNKQTRGSQTSRTNEFRENSIVNRLDKNIQ